MRALMVAAALIASSTVWAAEVASGPEPAPREVLRLSIDEALRTALSHNPAYRSIGLEEELARGQVLEALSEALPIITLTGSATRNHTESALTSLAAPGMTGLSPDPYNFYTGKVQLSQPIFKGGKEYVAVSAARKARLRAQEAVRGGRQSLTYDVKRAYYDALLAQEMLRVYTEALGLAREHLARIETKLGLGTSSRYELLRAKVEVKNEEAAGIQAQNARQLALAGLLARMGIGQDTPVELTDSLELRERAADDMEPLKRAAAEKRSDLRVARYEAGIQRDNIAAVRGDLLPKLFLTGSWGAESMEGHFQSDDWYDSWSAGATLSVPIFDGLKTHGKLVQEKARLLQMELREESLKELAELELRSALLRLRSAGEFVAAYREAVGEATEGARLAGLRYDSGVGTQLEVLDAQVALARAETNYAQAVYGYIIAGMDLEIASGTIGEEGEAAEKGTGEP